MPGLPDRVCSLSFPVPESSTPPPASSIIPTSPSPTATRPLTTTPRQTVGAPLDIAETPQSTTLVSRTYHWSYDGKEWTWSLDIPQSLYDYFKGLPRSPTSNYSIYVTHPSDDAYLGKLIAKLQDTAAAEGYSAFETVSFAAAFVQSLPYVTDNVSTGFDEYPRYPVETLVDNGGDCEDTSILMAALVNGIGYGVVMLYFKEEEHVAVGVKGGEGMSGTYWEYNGDKYYYLETTGENWDLGQIPPDYQNARANIYDMKPVPILTHTWKSTGRPGYADLEVKVSNLGSAPAQGVYIYAGFDAGNDQLWNPEQSALFDVGLDQEITVTLSLKVPRDVHTRIIVQIVYGGYAVDDSQSEWLDTN